MKPSARAEPARAGLIVGLALLHFACALHLAGWIALACGAGLSGWLVLPAWAAASASGAARGGRRGALLAAAAVVLVSSGALLLAATVFDVSWDGQAYHQEAVLALRGGWNPLRDGPLSLVRPDNIWINHYPKGVWIAQAVLFAASSSLEAAKAIGLIALVAAAALAHELLRARGTGRLAAGAAALVLAGNPIATAQLGSFYVDGVAVSLMLAFLCLALHPTEQARPSGLAGQAAALGFLLNTKFTSVVYAVVLLGGLAAALRPGLPERRRQLLSHAAALLIGVVGLGFDPYVSNTVQHGHPFHPVMGQHPVDFLSIQLTPSFQQRPRLVRLLIATFARPSNHNDEPKLAWPAINDPDEAAALAQADVRIGGFGPLWGSIVAAAFALGLAALARGRLSRPALGLAAAIGVSVLLNPACWWARYVPQLWFLPVALAILLLSQPAPQPSRLRPAGVALLLWCGFDAALVARAAWTGQWQASQEARHQLERLARVPGPVLVRWNGFEANRARLDAFKIAYAPTRGQTTISAERLVGSRAEIFLPPPRALAATTEAAP